MEAQEQLIKLIGITRQVRNLQTKYFEFRDKEVLMASKRWERILDDMLSNLVTEYAITTENYPEQPKLF